MRQKMWKISWDKYELRAASNIFQLPLIFQTYDKPYMGTNKENLGEDNGALRVLNQEQRETGWAIV